MRNTSGKFTVEEFYEFYGNIKDTSKEYEYYLEEGYIDSKFAKYLQENYPRDIIVVPDTIPNNFNKVTAYLDDQIGTKEQGQMLKAKYKEFEFIFYVSGDIDNVSAEDVALFYNHESDYKITGVDLETCEELLKQREI